jgi:cellulase/cellobiase CelA1
VAYAVTNQWPGGFQASVTVTNTGSTAVNPWKLAWSFTAGETISSLWSGDYTQSGAAVTVNAPSWGTSLPAGGNTVVGFTGVAPGTPGVPASFTLNGKACTKA